jgi:amino acid transporter
MADVGLLGGIMVAMWNYMGWDSASTIAAEVEAPDRTYPRAMLAAVGIVSLSYILPVLAAWLTGVPSGSFHAGFWADLAGLLAGPWLKTFTVAAATGSAFGMFNALVLSYSRLPLAMAEDGMLPRVFARVHSRTGAPWVSIVVLTIGWLLCLGLGFERLITLDILLYGGALLLEFVALVVLRIREPQMPRPFRVPGGTIAAAALGVLPAILLGISFVEGSGERILHMNALLFGALVVLLGFAVYGLSRLRKTLPLPAASAQETIRNEE